MGVTICHASIDERGKINGGVAGDQTSKEVCTRAWYNKPWKEMFRYPNEKVAKKAAATAKKLANCNLVGYDQYQRNTLYKQLEANGWNVDKYIASGVKTETDCSAFVYACYCVHVPALRSSANAPTTSTMKERLEDIGFKRYTDSSYLSKDNNLKVGDILNKPGSHVVMAITNGSNIKATTPTTSSNYAGKGIGYAVAKTGMHIRSGSGANHSSYGIIPKGTKLEVLEVLSNGWYKVVYNGSPCGYGYTSNTQNEYYNYTKNKKVEKTATKVTASNLPKSKSNSLNKEFLTTANLNVRDGAGTGYKILVTVPKGTLVRCYGYYTSAAGKKWLWIRFTLKGVQYTGYAIETYLG